jgi:hypothetical protein
MAVVAVDLLAPNGPLDSVLFPGMESRDVETLIGGYILSAAQDPYVLVADPTVQDLMTRYRALEYAFTAVHVRMSSEPASITVTEKGGHAYSTEQLRNIKELALSYRKQFEALIVAPAKTQGQFPGTVSSRINVEY